jgi:hypothetical protein
VNKALDSLRSLSKWADRLGMGLKLSCFLGEYLVCLVEDSVEHGPRQ